MTLGVINCNINNGDQAFGYMGANMKVRELGVAALAPLAVTFTCPTQPHATELDWVRSERGTQTLTRLASGFAGAFICDRLVDTSIAGEYLKAAFGNRSFSPDEVVQMMNLLVGTESLLANFPGATKEGICSASNEHYGPWSHLNET